uniref:Uncharacterized protein n=1 Tax=Acrobeloides nanus TaxID=290746 RepID=A0A914D860_9BILA
MRCHYDFPEVPNKATGKYSCRDDFEEIKLYSYEYTRVDHLWRTEITLRRTTFWCRRKEKDNEAIPSESGFICPENFQQLKLNLSTSINDWLVVCVGQDYQQDNQYQIPFGGFFSCQTPNKFAKCPDGYTQRPFIEIHYCDMFYCVHPNSKRNMPLPELRLPPFSKPSFEKNSTSREYTDQPYNDEQ